MKSKRKWKRYLPLYLMLIPGFLYLAINNYAPIYGLLMAFQKVNFRKGILGGIWVGLDNFRFLFQGDAWLITRNTVLYNLAFLILGPVIGIGLAILLNNLKSKKAAGAYQTIILVPFLMSMVVISYLAYAFLSPQSGLINGILVKLGFERISWYAEAKYWPVILIIIRMWNIMGFHSTIYFSSIVSISPTMLEAARLDGATRFQEIKYILIPMLKPTIITMTIIGIGSIMRSDFGLFYQVTRDSGALYKTTQTIDTYVFRGLMSLGNPGMAAAAGFYQSIVGFILVLLGNKVISKWSSEDALF